MAHAYPVVSADHHMWSSGLTALVTGPLDPAVGRRPATRSKAKEGLEGSHRLFASVVPEDELIQAHLQLRATDAVVRPDEPLLQVPNGTVSQRHQRFRALAEVASQGLDPRHVREL